MDRLADDSPILLVEPFYTETFKKKHLRTNGEGKTTERVESRRRYLLVVHKGWNWERESVWAETAGGSTCGVYPRAGELYLLLPYPEARRPTDLHICGSNLHGPFAISDEFGLLGPPDFRIPWTLDRWTSFGQSVRNTLSLVRPGCEGELNRFPARAVGSAAPGREPDSVVTIAAIDPRSGEPFDAGESPFSLTVFQFGKALQSRGSTATDPRCFLAHTATPINDEFLPSYAGDPIQVVQPPAESSQGLGIANIPKDPRIPVGAEFEVVVTRRAYGSFYSWPPE